MKYDIKNFNVYNKDSDVVLFIVKGYRYLRRHKLLEDSQDENCLWGSAIVARNKNGKVVGVMTYGDHEKGLWINLSFVDRSYLRRGIYRSMYEMLKEICVKRKKEYIKSLTHIRNKLMQKCAVKTGRRLTYVTLEWVNDKEKTAEGE